MVNVCPEVGRQNYQPALSRKLTAKRETKTMPAASTHPPNDRQMQTAVEASRPDTGREHHLRTGGANIDVMPATGAATSV